MNIYIFETVAVNFALLHAKSGDDFNLTQLLAGDIISISSTNNLLEKQDGSKILAISVERPNSQLIFEGTCSEKSYKNNTFKAPCIAIATTNPQWWDYYTIKGILVEIFPIYDIRFSTSSAEIKEITQLKIKVEEVTTKKT